jgi:integrase
VKLMERVRTLRRMHYSPRTEEAYVGWIVRFLRFTGMKHPLELGVDALRDFLNHLANERNVAESSQNQALCAVLFMYKQVLGMPLEVQAFDRPKRPRHLPGVLDTAQVRALLRAMRPPYALVAAVLYGAGMRLHECLGVRVKRGRPARQTRPWFVRRHNSCLHGYARLRARTPVGHVGTGVAPGRPACYPLHACPPSPAAS